MVTVIYSFRYNSKVKYDADRQRVIFLEERIKFYNTEITGLERQRREDPLDSDDTDYLDSCKRSRKSAREEHRNLTEKLATSS